MQNFHSKSIILGIGIGLVLVSTAGFIVSGAGSPKSSMSEADIIREAEKLGMIKSSQVFSTPDSTPKQQVQATPTLAPEQTPAVTASPTPKPTPSPEPQPEVIFTVSPGDTAVAVADKLLQAKLITDKDSFVTEMIDSGAAYRIVARTYKLRQGMSPKDIIQALLAK